MYPEHIHGDDIVQLLVDGNHAVDHTFDFGELATAQVGSNLKSFGVIKEGVARRTPTIVHEGWLVRNSVGRYEKTGEGRERFGNGKIRLNLWRHMRDQLVGIRAELTCSYLTLNRLKAKGLRSLRLVLGGSSDG